MFSRDLVFDRIYRHPPERVWRALTEPEALARWLMENDFEPRVGHRFQFRTDPAPGFDGIVDCEVLAVEPPTYLSYTWTGGPIDTVLSFELEPIAEGTRLHVEQRGFEGLKATLVSFFLQRGIKPIYDQKLPAVLDSLDDSDPSEPEADAWRSPALDVAMEITAILPDGSREAASGERLEAPGNQPRSSPKT